MKQNDRFLMHDKIADFKTEPSLLLKNSSSTKAHFYSHDCSVSKNYT